MTAVPAESLPSDQDAMSLPTLQLPDDSPSETGLNTSSVFRQDTIKASAGKGSSQNNHASWAEDPSNQRREKSRSRPNQRPSPPLVRIDPYYGAHGPQVRPHGHQRHHSVSTEAPYSHSSVAYVPHYHHAYAQYPVYDNSAYESDYYAGSPSSATSPILYASPYHGGGNDMHQSYSGQPVLYATHALSATSSSTSTHPSPHGESPDPSFYSNASRGDGSTMAQPPPVTFSSESSPIQSPLTPSSDLERPSLHSMHQPFGYYEMPPSAFHRSGYQPSYVYARWPAFDASGAHIVPSQMYPGPYGSHSAQPMPSGPHPIPGMQQRSYSFSHAVPPPQVSPTWLYGSSPPLPYSPPKELARGSLAQAHMHQALADPQVAPVDRRRQHGPKSAMPKPPPHSPHALWAGNVPSDATHAELWRFFTTRSPPSSSPKYAKRPDDLPEHIDLSTTGVESIHLIARSNCAFVNYASDPHLQHAIAVATDVPLRPFDARCKPLLCRVRKLTDDNKSGVGAQRQGGMHKAYVDAEKRKVEAAQDERKASIDEPLSPRESVSQSETGVEKQNSISSSQGANSLSTASTTSSFLTQHFPKRFFVLKSHDEKELALSVEKGVWATQPHNEPVLDQAYRTCRDGVFLIFSANKSGEFYGYAKMAGPISGSEPNSLSSGKPTADTQSKTEDKASKGDDSLQPPLPPEAATSSGMLLSPSERRYAPESPGKIDDEGDEVQNRSRGVSAPASIPFRDAATSSMGAEIVAANLALPDTRKADSLDPKLLSRMRNVEISDKAVEEQQKLGSSIHGARKGEDGVWRKDTILSPEERNLRLEKLEDEGKIDVKPAPTGWNNPFRVDWIKVERVPFARTRHIKNAFNANREVKISRDGTEIEPSAGVALIEQFWQSDPSPTDTVTSHKLPSPALA